MDSRIGVITSLQAEGRNLKEVAAFGLKTCQLNCWNPELYTPERVDAIRQESEETGIHISSLWAGWPGPAVWDFVDGPTTLGIVPHEYRDIRVDALKRGGEFANQLGLPAIVTHLGFIPENATDPLFDEVVEIVRDIALFLKDLGLQFWFETGQETPVTMRRLIEVVDTGNLGVNLDPANLILYGKANPIDALDVFGESVFSIHAKDGLYPTDPMKLGHEVKVGSGKVKFPEFFQRLKEIGYSGAFIIEREISGPQQHADIAETVRYLDGLIERVGL
jgi:L-ribulose-5-phosphate 3-epimerase